MMRGSLANFFLGDGIAAMAIARERGRKHAVNN
jgi:hypothetical protein